MVSSRKRNFNGHQFKVQDLGHGTLVLFTLRFFRDTLALDRGSGERKDLPLAWFIWHRPVTGSKIILRGTLPYAFPLRYWRKYNAG